MLKLSARLRALQSHISSGQIVTREYLESFEPKNLRRLKVFDETPPEDFVGSYFEKLTTSYSNPRSILKLYRKYISIDDYPCYSWLVRCLCQLGNSFSFNSFWSSSDRQALTKLPLFKYLIYDLIERKHYIHPRHVPRMIFALTALEYRCWPLLSYLLSLVKDHLKDWRLPTLSCMIGCLTQLGIGNDAAESEIIMLLLDQVEQRDESDSTLFDWALLSYSLVLLNLYEWPMRENAALPRYLKNTCAFLTNDNLPLSGWIQYYLYMILYCTDVEKPGNELNIKESIPFSFQESLHIRWLNDILVHAQPQGSEWLQSDVDNVMEGLGIKERLLNCSVGRDDDEQHCLFTGHLFPNRRLCLEYNFLMPKPDDTPIESGLISFRRRLFNKLGYNTAIIHKYQWDLLKLIEKEEQITRILSKFPIVDKNPYDSSTKPKEYSEDKKYKYLKHLRPKITSWPPDKISV